ncbi:unnamed protein product [Hydatigera taeniaeformis]|uniref:Secreted protein n=1 Tax=Hydatigena taeniaeformis TaxID=6205 RepID=A0A0R3X2C2_HYDTA|nr:unnamed protein product [Hydatigera taeniaeformis]
MRSCCGAEACLWQTASTNQGDAAGDQSVAFRPECLNDRRGEGGDWLDSRASERQSRTDGYATEQGRM